MKKIMLAVSFMLILAEPTFALAATTVNLGTAGNFAVLAGSGITNTGATTITGDVGTFPTITETGFGSVSLGGVNHAGDAVTQVAKTDLTTAYTNAVGQGPTTPIVADLGGQTLSPGIYNSSSSIGLTGTLTLNGDGDPNAVFIFQAGSTLTTASASRVNLINSAQSCHVFWQVGSSATLGTTTNFKGNILAFSSITDDGGSTVDGSLLARNAAITLNNTTISQAICAVPPVVQSALLNVVKVVVNDNGKTKAVSDFPLFVNGTSVTSGVINTFPVGAYAITETTDPYYIATFSGDCDATGHINLVAGDNKTCTITNNDVAVAQTTNPTTPTTLPTTGQTSRYIIGILAGIILVVASLIATRRKSTT